MAELRANIHQLELDLMKVSHIHSSGNYHFRILTIIAQAHKSKIHEVQTLQEQQESNLLEYNSRIKQVEDESYGLERKLLEAQQVISKLALQVEEVSDLLLRLVHMSDPKTQSKSAFAEVFQAKETTQSELDDLLIVFGDLEEKVTKYKVCVVYGY